MFFKFKSSRREFALGDDNEIYIDNKKIDCDSLYKIKGNISISIIGSNNKIYIEDLSKIKNSYIFISGNNNKAIIKSTSSSIRGLQICMYRKQNNREVSIGKNNFINGDCVITCIGENKKVIIGSNCKVGPKTQIITTDFHNVYDIKTNELINKEKDIFIADDVWIAQDVQINKGSYIPNGCIIGARAFVNKKFDEQNCLIAGIPAKITKKGVYWQ